MSFYQKASNFLTGRGWTLATAQPTSANIGKRKLDWASRAVSKTRQDIKSMNNARQLALAEEPKNWMLQLLIDDVCDDPLLTSQMENRMQQPFSIGFKLKNPKGEPDEEQTDLLKKMPAYRRLSMLSAGKKFYGYNLAELSLVKKPDGSIGLEVTEIPRTNVVPKTGLFYPDYSEDKTIKYREMPEYGTYILEFNSGELGLVNKAIPDVLFKRFAKSCWSELCEIHGIPPRYMKTNTQDPVQMARAQQMMQDMGAAAWFIIDETEEFSFADSVNTNGDVYKNLLTACKNDICLLITGAVIGQDTEHGNRSKEDSSKDLLWQLVLSDMASLEEDWNNIILPALANLGIIKPGLRFEFDEVEDIAELWKMTAAILPFKKVNDEWIIEKFGIKVEGDRESATAAGAGASKLQLDADFFA